MRTEQEIGSEHCVVGPDWNGDTDKPKLFSHWKCKKCSQEWDIGIAADWELPEWDVCFECGHTAHSMYLPEDSGFGFRYETLTRQQKSALFFMDHQMFMAWSCGNCPVTHKQVGWGLADSFEYLICLIILESMGYVKRAGINKDGDILWDHIPQDARQ